VTITDKKGKEGESRKWNTTREFYRKGSLEGRSGKCPNQAAGEKSSLSGGGSAGWEKLGHCEITEAQQNARPTNPRKKSPVGKAVTKRGLTRREKQPGKILTGTSFLALRTTFLPGEVYKKEGTSKTESPPSRSDCKKEGVSESKEASQASRRPGNGKPHPSEKRQGKRNLTRTPRSKKGVNVQMSRKSKCRDRKIESFGAEWTGEGAFRLDPMISKKSKEKEGPWSIEKECPRRER